MRLYSRKEAAKMLGIGLSPLDTMRSEGKIGYYQKRPGCKVQFTQSQIDRYLDRVEQAPKSVVRKKRQT